MLAALSDARFLSAVLHRLTAAVGLLFLVTALLAPLEAVAGGRRAKILYPGWPVDLAWYFVTALVGAFMLAPFAALIGYSVRLAIPDRVIGLTADLGFWSRAALALVIGEIGFYWAHRLSHEIPWLWRFHAVHHSAEHVGFLVNTRAHPLDMLVQRAPGLGLLSAAGLADTAPPPGALVPAAVLLVGALWSYFVHADMRVRLPILEQLVSTPAFHHWRLSRSDHPDHNFAALLPVLDHIFGTHYLPRHWPADYGVAAPMPPTLIGQLLEPFASTATDPKSPERAPAGRHRAADNPPK